MGRPAWDINVHIKCEWGPFSNSRICSKNTMVNSPATLYKCNMILSYVVRTFALIFDSLSMYMTRLSKSYFISQNNTGLHSLK